MNKTYEQPNVKIMALTVDDVIRTSTPGVGSFNPMWLLGSPATEEFTVDNM